MPYEVRKIPDEEVWEIVNGEGEVKARKTEQGDADKLVQVLNSVEIRMEKKND